MIDKCPHDDCYFRNEYGYCKVTACTNPLYKDENVCKCAEASPDWVPSRICAICGKHEHEMPMIETKSFWLCKKCLNRLKEMNYPVIDFSACEQDEIQHVGYDAAQCGREK